MHNRAGMAAIAGALLLASGCGEEPGRDMTAKEVAAELADVKITPGLWEATNIIESVRAPMLPDEVKGRMEGRRTTVRNCITPEQAARPNAAFLTAQENSQCSYRDFSMRNGRMQGMMTCQGGALPGEMRMEMEGRYGPESYDVAMDMEAAGLPGGAMTIKARTTGRRIGACDGETEQ